MSITIGDSISDAIEKHSLKNYHITLIWIKLLKKAEWQGDLSVG